MRFKKSLVFKGFSLGLSLLFLAPANLIVLASSKHNYTSAQTIVQERDHLESENKNFNVEYYNKSFKIKNPCLCENSNYKVYLSQNNDCEKDFHNTTLLLDSSENKKYFNVFDKKIEIDIQDQYYCYLYCDDVFQDKCELKKLEQPVYWTDEGNYSNEWYKDKMDKINELKKIQISSAKELAAFSKLVSDGNDFENIEIELKEDIDISEYSWAPIGFSTKTNEMKNFKGSFNGKDNSINGLYISGDEAYQGLFACNAKEGQIKNLHLINSFIAGSYCVGGIASVNEGFIKNCYNEGLIFFAKSINDFHFNNLAEIDNSNYGIGGLVGNNKGQLEYSYNKAKINAAINVGGLIGINKGEVTNCYNESKIQGYFFVGGLVGNNKSGSKILDSYNNGQVIGTNYVGGILGSSCYSELKDISNNAIVSAESFVGGILGQSYGNRIIRNFNEGKVRALEGNVGGIVGGCKQSGNKTVIKSCYNQESIRSKNCVGGIVGSGENYDIKSSLNIGDITGEEYVGGIVGVSYEKSKISCVYNTGTISGKSNVGGICGLNRGKIFSIYNNARVNGLNINIGGIAGINEGKIKTGYSVGRITSELGKIFKGVVAKNTGQLSCLYYYDDEIYLPQNGVEPFIDFVVNKDSNKLILSKVKCDEVLEKNMGLEIQYSEESEISRESIADIKEDGISIKKIGDATLKSRIHLIQNEITQDGFLGSPRSIDINVNLRIPVTKSFFQNVFPDRDDKSLKLLFGQEYTEYDE